LRTPAAGTITAADFPPALDHGGAANTTILDKGLRVPVASEKTNVRPSWNTMTRAIIRADQATQAVDAKGDTRPLSRSTVRIDRF
jgi:hypothetical protein